MKLNLDIISIGYIVCIGVICHLCDISEILKALLALPAFLIIPKQTGDLVLVVLRRIIKGNFSGFDIVSEFIILWLLGLITLFVSLIFLVNLPFWNLNYYLLTLLSLIFINVAYGNQNINKKTANFPENLNRIFGDYRVIILLLITGFLSMLSIKYYIPFPIISDPIYNYILHTLKFIDGGIFVIGYGHIPIVPMLFGINSKIFNLHPIFLYSVTYILQILLYSIGVYLFSYQVSKKISISLLTVFFGLWIISSVRLNNSSSGALLFIFIPYMFFLIDKNIISNDIEVKRSFYNFFFIALIAVMFFLQKFVFTEIERNIFIIALPIFLFFLLNVINDAFAKKEFLLLSLISISICLIHNYVGPIIIFLVIIYILIRYVIKNELKYISMIYLFFAITFLLFLFQKINLISFDDNLTLSRHFFGDVYDTFWFNMNFSQKYDWMVNNGSYFMIKLFSLGTILAIVKKDYKVMPVLSCSVACFFLLFFPEGHFWRILTFNNLFIAFGVAYSVVYLIKGISVCIKKNKIKNMLIILLSFLIIISMFFNVIMPKCHYIEEICKSNNENYFSFQFTYEINTAFWLYDNTPKIWVREPLWTDWMQEEDNNMMIIHPPLLRDRPLKIEVSTTSDTLIISDPYTMFMMEGLTGRDQAVYRRVWVDENEYAPEILKQMEDIKNRIFEAKDSESAYEEIQKIKRNHSKILIIIDERTSRWLKQDQRMFIQWPPRGVEMGLFDKFKDEKYFDLVYYIENRIYIFEVI